MQLGFIGLGKMGKNMVTRLLQGGHEVVVFDRDSEPVKELVALGATASDSVKDLVSKLKSQRIIWSMLPSGEITEDNINTLSELVAASDIIIDGGNSMYKDSIRRAEKLKEKQILFLDIGVSGGIWGLKEGYCLMAGGEQSAYTKIEPILKTLATENGYSYIGGNGSGHFVKMIHNGIEYAMLQAYAEGLDIIQAKKDWDIDLEGLCKLWNHGSVIRSWLLELSQQVFQENKTLEGIKGYVEDSGEGRWTVAEAIEQSVPAPTITLALMERFHSRRTESFGAKVIVALRNKFGGHKVR